MKENHEIFLKGILKTEILPTKLISLYDRVKTLADKRDILLDDRTLILIAALSDVEVKAEPVIIEEPKKEEKPIYEKPKPKPIEKPKPEPKPEPQKKEWAIGEKVKYKDGEGVVMPNKPDTAEDEICIFANNRGTFNLKIKDIV